MKQFLGILFFTIVAFTGLQSCSSKGNAPVMPPTSVNLYTVQERPAVYYDEYPANVVALSQVDLRPQVEGYITSIFFKEGDHVSKGQKLYEIDRSKYLAAYDQAVANVKVAEANKDQAQKDADRYTYLNEHDAVAKQTLDHALTTLQNAKSQITAAKQDQVRTQTDLKYSLITAPFDGTIGLSQVKIGTLAVAGQTLLNTISTDNPMAVDFVINEKQLSRFLQLQKVKTDSLFTLLMPDNTLYPHTGAISVIDRGVDPVTGTIKIRLQFSNTDFELRAGMSCKVRVRNTDAGNQIIIPNKAIVEQMGEYFVFVKKDSADKTIATQRKVTPGQQIGANIIIKNGLVPGEQIIIDGVQKVRNGASINPGKPGGQQKSGH